MSADLAGSPPAHVVMVVGNDVRSDTRVKKSAVSLVRAGLQVTVVGYTRRNRREEAWMSGVRVIRVPIQWRLRTDPSAGLARVAVGYRSDESVHRAGLKLWVRRTDLDAWRSRRTASGAGLVTQVGYRAGRAGLSLAARLIRWSRTAQRPFDQRRERRIVAGRGGSRAWRETVPVALDLELAMLDELVALRPDVIHAHDVSVVGLAAKAASLAAGSRAGRTRVPWVYDAHEYVAGISLYKSRTALERAGWLALERQYVPDADRIVTVSPGLADLLVEQYRPAAPPSVVINAPWPGENHPGGGLREAVELGPDVPIIVYSGGLTEARGVQTVIDALPMLPDVHLVVVPVPATSPYMTSLRTRARQLGVAERLHVAPPVPPAEVVANLSTADIGLIPIMRFPSHDVALTNKLFEYLHAGLPVVVSDCPAQRDFVAAHGVGAAFVTGDADDLARTIRAVRDDIEAYKVRVKDPELLETWSWRHAEQELVAVYRELLGSAVTDPKPVAAFPSLDEEVSPAGEDEDDEDLSAGDSPRQTPAPDTD